MKVEIKNPCSEDWSKMKIGVKSRHCEMCVKSVVDFTEMTRDEILVYLIQNQNQSTCARMLGGQTDFHFTELEAMIEGTRKHLGNRAFLVLSLATLALASCDTQPVSVDGFNPTQGELIQVDTLISKDTTFPAKNEIDTLPRQDDTEIGKIVSKKSVCEPKKGEIDSVFMGDIVIIQPEVIEPEILGLVTAEPEPEPLLTSDSTIHDFVEKMPEFVGGVDSLMAFLSRNLTYPKQAKRNEIEGTVYAQFVVNTDGSISDINILKGVGYGCDEESRRVLGSMPKWIPGETHGKMVRVKYTLPFKFRLK